MVQDDPTRTTAIGMARYAVDFLSASHAADEIIGRGPQFNFVAPIPVLYLAGHSIKLSLKAFLLHRGETLRDLRKKYGHNLRKSFKKAKELGLLTHVRFEEVEVGAFESLDELYSTKQLEYIVTGPKTFPMYGPVSTFARKLSEAVCLLVRYVP